MECFAGYHTMRDEFIFCIFCIKCIYLDCYFFFSVGEGGSMIISNLGSRSRETVREDMQKIFEEVQTMRV
jgi:hypothetical protein